MFQDEEPAEVLLKDCIGQVLSTLLLEDTWGMVSSKPCLDIFLVRARGHWPGNMLEITQYKLLPAINAVSTAHLLKKVTNKNITYNFIKLQTKLKAKVIKFFVSYEERR